MIVVGRLRYSPGTSKHAMGLELGQCCVMAVEELSAGGGKLGDVCQHFDNGHREESRIEEDEQQHSGCRQNEGGRDSWRRR